MKLFKIHKDFKDRGIGHKRGTIIQPHKYKNRSVLNILCIPDEYYRQVLNLKSAEEIYQEYNKVKLTWNYNYEVTYENKNADDFNGYLVDTYRIDKYPFYYLTIELIKYEANNKIKKPAFIITFPYNGTIGLKKNVMLDFSGCYEVEKEGFGIVLAKDEEELGNVDILVGGQY